VWLFWPSASHGLSGVVYGLLGYLLLIGWLEKRPLSMLLSAGCLLAYGQTGSGKTHTMSGIQELTFKVINSFGTVVDLQGAPVSIELVFAPRPK
jgi:membrane associated rhomboid family serine protease